MADLTLTKRRGSTYLGKGPDVVAGLFLPPILLQRCSEAGVVEALDLDPGGQVREGGAELFEQDSKPPHVVGLDANLFDENVGFVVLSVAGRALLTIPDVLDPHQKIEVEGDLECIGKGALLGNTVVLFVVGDTLPFFEALS